MSDMLRLQDIDKSYPMGEERVQVLRQVSLTVQAGEFISILGASGSGKSTLMNIIGCMDTADRGSYSLDGEDVFRLDARQLAALRNRKIGFIFQRYHLLAQYDVLQNVMMPLLLRGFSHQQAAPLAVESLTAMGLGDRLRHRPNQLSGGQQQRVAIARALVKTPNVLLLDEPLSNLDARLRLQTREEIRKIQQETRVTTVFVTHDQEEAMSISDQIVVMKDGIFMQMGRPQEVYDDPASLFVAKFLGNPPINMFKGEVRKETLWLGDQPVLSVKGVPDQPVTVGIRPEGFILTENGPFAASLSRVEVMGRDVSVISSHPCSENPSVRSIITAETPVDRDAGSVHFSLKPSKVFLFHRETGARIPFSIS